ncbi:MAG: SPOR domain-containing protein [Acidobacteriota bacterium]|jgi:cell division protein FtsN|nr:SPOR domain-containing protein [Acidobacteriota bacterium]
MSYQTDTDNESDLELDNRKLVMIFVGLLVICGCFFVMGRLSVRYDGVAGTEVADSSAKESAGLNDLDDPGLENYNRLTGIVSTPEASAPSAVTDEPSRLAATTASAPVAANTPPAVPDAPVTQAPPVATAVPDAPKPTPKQAVERIKEVAKKVLPPATPAPPSDKSTWSVQVAAFHARREVENKARELKAKGFDPRIEVPQPPDEWYRLKVGKFATRAEANAMAGRVKDSGFDAIVKENKEN